MKQLLQNLKDGKVSVQDVPAPQLREDGVLVRNEVSLISAGTERMMVKLGKKSLLGKARERPDLVQKVLNKLRRDGFWATFQSVRQQLDREVPMGYSVAGRVLKVGSRAPGFEVGQLVACAGAGCANHAEVNYVPRLLTAPVPEGVTAEQAAYTTVGTIALQGIRNADVRAGETVLVIGLGLIGQLAVQMLRASGCRVAGLDLAEDRVQLAGEHGADLALISSDEHDYRRQVMEFSRGRGVDAVLITAATSSNAPVELAAELARDRARVVMVGVTGMDIPRTPYFKKELTFIVSRSYGPGRYDSHYEEQGHDYPIGHVRWTENRNQEAFLDFVASGDVRPEICTTHRFPIDEADKAFEMILTDSERFLGVVLTYPERSDRNGHTGAGDGRIVLHPGKPAGAEQVGVSFLGAGSFSRSVLLPHLAKIDHCTMRGIVTASGISARGTGKQFAFEFCASDTKDILDDDQTQAVFIATQHAEHAQLVCRALEAGKAVFVEKPLAISLDQLHSISAVLAKPHSGLMVGFNRRFSPHAVQVKEFLAGAGPLAIQYRCNAGQIPPDHWVADPAQGGRIIGEACHFLDLFAYWIDADPARVVASSPIGDPENDLSISVSYEDGSTAQLIYTTAGPPGLGKERCEVIAGGRAAILDDFRHLVLQSESSGSQESKLRATDKGHAEELRQFIDAVRTGSEMPIPVQSLLDTTQLSLAAVDSARRGEAIRLSELNM